jgi:predicted nucleotidyltransferase
VADPKDEIPAIWPAEYDARELLRRLTTRGVDFVVIGGVAMILHGSARLTRDLDIIFAPDDGNLHALGRVLADSNARLREVGDEVPFVADGATLRNVQLLTLTTDAGWIDVHRTVDGAPSYGKLRAAAERMDLGGFSVLVASLDDMLAMKRTAGRPLDQVDVETLEAIKRLRASRD